MPWSRLAREIKRYRPDLPVVLLAFDDRELSDLLTHADRDIIDQIFLWHGDFRILLGIIKSIEDKWNVEADVEMAEVSRLLTGSLPVVQPQAFSRQATTDRAGSGPVFTSARCKT